jgi:hypothetical protein
MALGPLIGWVLALTVKHVLGDFFLQTMWMAGKDRKTGWALPLLVHCLIHGVLTTLIMLVAEPRLWFIGLLDFAIHITIDRIKGFSVAHFGITKDDRWFWWVLGVDQALHQLTNFFLAILIVANS